MITPHAVWERLNDVELEVRDQGRRLTWLESLVAKLGGSEKSAPAGASLKEAAMIALIGVLVGMMWATGDPAGVVAFLKAIK